MKSHEHRGVSNYRQRHRLTNRLFRRTSKKMSNLRITGRCEEKSPVNGGFPSQMVSNAEMFRFHDVIMFSSLAANKHHWNQWLSCSFTLISLHVTWALKCRKSPLAWLFEILFGLSSMKTSKLRITLSLVDSSHNGPVMAKAHLGLFHRATCILNWYKWSVWVI